jgi:hypothetical protein
MASIDENEFPLPVRRFANSRRIRVVTIPGNAIEPIRNSFKSAWELATARKEAEESEPEESPVVEEEPVPEVDPPETYGEHGELVNPHSDLPPKTPHLDLKG